MRERGPDLFGSPYEQMLD